ncbi:MAG: type II toxin-antitoxin system RelE/ParE family toxin [Opitutales bacterium]
MKRVIILPFAKEDLRQAGRFYDCQSEGLGEYFLDAITAEIDALAFFPGRHQKRGTQFRLLAKKFPFYVYYQLDEELVFVRAVVDARSDPAAIEAREIQEEREID